MGEPDVKTGAKEMENQQEANNMMAMFERMLQEQRATSEIAAVVEWFMQREGCITIFAGLQGGNATVRNIGRIASDILQSGGYERASREYPQDTTTKSDVGSI